MQQGVVAVIRRGEEVLVIRRGAGVAFAGYWAPVSGKVEPGEEPEAAVVREVREELGIAVRPVGRVWECASSDGAYWLHWWLAEPVDEEVTLMPNAREVDGTRWLRPADLRGLEPVFESDLHFFERIFPTLGRGE